MTASDALLYAAAFATACAGIGLLIALALTIRLLWAEL